MNEQFKLNLVSEEAFVDKLDRLITVLSTSPALAKTKLVLLTDPNDPDKFILSQNNIDVTQTIRDLILTDAPELQLEPIKEELTLLKADVIKLQEALDSKPNLEDVCTKAELTEAVKAAVAEANAWENF